MVARMSHCDRRRLQLAIDNRLGPVQEEDLSRHLQSCPHCQNELQQLAGSQECWNEIRTLLSSSDELAALDEELTAPLVLPAAEGRREVNCPGEELSLDFLAPSEHPRMLGRLGNYEVEEVIGRGGMGIVLKAQDPTLNRCVAVKVMVGSLASSAAARKRFAREAQAAAAVVHDHVIPIYAVDTSGKTPFLVMPYVTGRSLQDRLDDAGTLATRQVLRIASQIARGLAAAHAQGLIHRDIKPANILLENGVERVRITDFGLARASDDASQTQSGFIAGTPQYMAPEQARGEAIDTRADLFSLGSVMYAMCAGHPPFRAETTLAVLRRICDDRPRDVREVNPDVPKWLADIIHRLLSKSPADRFGSAEEVAKLLESWLAHLQQPDVFAPPDDAYLVEKRRRWRRALGGTAIMAVLTTLILVGIGSFWEAGETARELPNGQQSPGLDSASATAEPVEAVAIPAETLDSELDEIWRATDGVGQRMPQGGSDAASLLRQVVWELGEELRSLEQELDSPLTTPPPVENRPEPSPHEFSNFPFNKGDSHEDRP